MAASDTAPKAACQQQSATFLHALYGCSVNNGGRFPAARSHTPGGGVSEVRKGQGGRGREPWRVETVEGSHCETTRYDTKYCPAIGKGSFWQARVF